MKYKRIGTIYLLEKNFHREFTGEVFYKMKGTQFLVGGCDYTIKQCVIDFSTYWMHRALNLTCTTHSDLFCD